jgi:hypothetical protein
MAARWPRRGLAWALAASVVLHLLTLAVGPVRLGAPALEPAAPLPPRMAVRLLPPPRAEAGPRPLLPPAPAAVPSRPVRPPPPMADTGTAAAGPTTAAPSTAVPAEAPDPAATVAGAPAPTAGPAAADTARPGPADTSGNASTAAADAPPIDAAAPASATAQAGAAPGTVRFPRSGRLEYAVTIGDPPAPVGRATYAWEASDESYRLSLSAETTGLVGLLRRVRVVQTSEGRITAEGLRPDAFAMDRGPKARNEFARFDWPAKQLTFGYPDAVQTAALGAGAQDTLSLILQFAFVPIEQGRRDVLLTTGRKVYVQAYERVAEELIETPAGGWRAWHLRRVRAQPGDEGYDMWLATDRPYLPVRIRWTDRNGRVTSANLDTVRLARD